MYRRSGDRQWMAFGCAHVLQSDQSGVNVKMGNDQAFARALYLCLVCVRVDERVWWEVSASCASAGWGVITVGSKTQTRPTHLWSSQKKNMLDVNNPEGEQTLMKRVLRV